MIENSYKTLAQFSDGEREKYWSDTGYKEFGEFLVSMHQKTYAQKMK